MEIPNLESNKWLPENPIDSEISGELEVKGLVSGKYYLALELYDPLVKRASTEEALKLFPSTANNSDNIYARYSIRMANTESDNFTWEPQTGLDQLGTVMVK